MENKSLRFYITSFFQNALQAEISRCYGFRWIGTGNYRIQICQCFFRIADFKSSFRSIQIDLG